MKGAAQFQQWTTSWWPVPAHPGLCVHGSFYQSDLDTSCLNISPKDITLHLLFKREQLKDTSGILNIERPFLVGLG